MNQEERRSYMLDILLAESSNFSSVEIPQDEKQQEEMLKAFIAIRNAKPISNGFLRVQNEYLNEELNKKGIIDVNELQPYKDNICIWNGDITTLKCDVIVNDANASLQGVYMPGSECTDARIHFYAGVQLRKHCYDLMQQQGYYEPAGQAKLTPGFNLPVKGIIHTVAPVSNGVLDEETKEKLADCYISALQLAEQNNYESIAFSCIGTTYGRISADEAGSVAIQAVKRYLKASESSIRVVFVCSDTQMQAMYMIKMM